ncbi:MAG: hypothetical protein ABJF50_10545 [Paracoccaceae bacterium]
MGDWIENLKTTWGILISNPLILILSIGFVLLVYRLQGRFERRAEKAQKADQLAGWTADTTTVKRPHETGVGSQDVLVLKPTRHILKVAFLTLAFFGGGAVFFALVVLPNPVERTFENIMGFVIMCAFSIGALFLLGTYFTRFDVTENEIVHRRLLRRRQRYPLSTLVAVKPAGKNPTLGIKLTFADGRELALWARFQGYAAMLSKLKHVHPDFLHQLALGRMAQKMRAPNAV